MHPRSNSSQLASYLTQVASQLPPGLRWGEPGIFSHTSDFKDRIVVISTSGWHSYSSHTNNSRETKWENSLLWLETATQNLIGVSVSETHTSGVYAKFSVRLSVPYVMCAPLHIESRWCCTVQNGYFVDSAWAEWEKRGFEDDKNEGGPTPCFQDSSRKGGKVCRKTRILLTVLLRLDTALQEARQHHRDREYSSSVLHHQKKTRFHGSRPHDT